MSNAPNLAPSLPGPGPGRADKPSPPTDSCSTQRRLAWLTRVVAVALLGGFLLSFRLWLTDRSYPLTPVSDLLPPVPPPFDTLWFGAMVLLLPAIALFPRPRWLLVSLLVLACGSALWDQSRWQPWFYPYLPIFGAL